MFFKNVSFENIYKNFVRGKLVFSAKIKECLCQHQFLAKWQTWPSGGRLFLSRAALDFKSE